jgi:AraC-like DNA-binding protein
MPSANPPNWTPNWTATTGVAEARPIYVRVFEYPRGYRSTEYRQRSAKLVYPIRGLASVYTQHGHWLATPLRGVIIPSWQQHRVSAAGNVLLHSVFVDPKAYPDCLRDFGMMNISPLLHELIKEGGKYFTDYRANSTEQKILEVVVELLQRATVFSEEQYLPTIHNPRVEKAIAQSNSHTLRSADIAQRAAYSPRQFARVFKADTGMAFKDWRALYHVQQGIKLLHQKKSVTEVANLLGFSSASAFVTLFKKHTGSTPKSLRL